MLCFRGLLPHGEGRGRPANRHKHESPLNKTRTRTSPATPRPIPRAESINMPCLVQLSPRASKASSEFRRPAAGAHFSLFGGFVDAFSDACHSQQARLESVSWEEAERLRFGRYLELPPDAIIYLAQAMWATRAEVALCSLAFRYPRADARVGGLVAWLWLFLVGRLRAWGMG